MNGSSYTLNVMSKEVWGMTLATKKFVGDTCLIHRKLIYSSKKVALIGMTVLNFKQHLSNKKRDDQKLE